MAALEVLTTRPIPPQEWESHREKLYQLYITDNRRLRDVMICMQEGGFMATRRQYTKQFNKWSSFNKNNKRQDAGISSGTTQQRKSLAESKDRKKDRKIQRSVKRPRVMCFSDSEDDSNSDVHPTYQLALTPENSDTSLTRVSSLPGTTHGSFRDREPSTVTLKTLPSTPFLSYRAFEWAKDQENIRNLLSQHVQWLDHFYQQGTNESTFPLQVTPWDITESDWRALLTTGILVNISSLEGSQKPPVSPLELPTASRVLFESIRMIMQASRIPDIIVVRAQVLLGVLRKNQSPLIDILPNRFVLFITALMLSQKVLDDAPYSNATWAKMTHIPSSTLFKAELSFLSHMDFRLCRGRSRNWDDQTLDFLLYRSSFLEYCLGVHMMNAQFYRSVQIGAQQASLRSNLGAFMFYDPFLPIGETPLSNHQYNDASFLFPEMVIK